MRLSLGPVTVTVKNDRMLTAFGDGTYIIADISEQPGQAKTAAELGMTVTEMNRTHDLAHSLIAHMLGLPCSPTLHATASGRTYEYWREEENLVLALQRFARILGIDLIELARRYSAS